MSTARREFSLRADFFVQFALFCPDRLLRNIIGRGVNKTFNPQLQNNCPYNNRNAFSGGDNVAQE